MPLELELPQQVETTPSRATPEPSQEKEAAKAAAVAALDAAGDAAAEPQREGSTAVTVRLTRPVEDPQSAFYAVAGQTFDGYVDAAGETWLPLATGDIMLEAKEFEVVEPLADAVPAATTAVDVAPVDVAADGAVMPTGGPQTQQTDEIPAVVAATQTCQQPEPKPDPKWSPSALANQSAEALRRKMYLREKDILQEQISALAIEQVKLKEQIKRCKKESEVLVERLNNLIENWEHPPAASGPVPTADAVADGSGRGLADQPAEHASPAEPASSPGEPQVLDDLGPEPDMPQQSYQSVLEAETLAVLGLKESVAAKLSESGVETLWQLEMLRKDISEGRKEWPKGIGKAKVTAIEDAILAWCAANSGRWDAQQGTNDQAEAAADAERAEAVKESQPPTVQPADIDDL